VIDRGGVKDREGQRGVLSGEFAILMADDL